MPKTGIQKIILPVLSADVESGFLLWRENINCKILEIRLGKYLNL
jgi:hypothetical protein